MLRHWVGSIYPPLSEEQLALLSLSRLARVTISSLTVPQRKTSNRGKPPRPLSSKKWWVKHL